MSEIFAKVGNYIFWVFMIAPATTLSRICEKLLTRKSAKAQFFGPTYFKNILLRNSYLFD